MTIIDNQTIIDITENNTEVVVNTTQNIVEVNENNTIISVQIIGVQGPKGDGITSINTLTATNQFITTGTSGADVNVVSVVDTHTINIPTASATKRGAVNSADWNTFNNKASIAYVNNAIANANIDAGTF